jgi:hypothetical protein
MLVHIGQQVIRQVPDGQRQGVVKKFHSWPDDDGVLVSTGIGSVHCDTEGRLRAVELRTAGIRFSRHDRL